MSTLATKNQLRFIYQPSTPRSSSKRPHFASRPANPILHRVLGWLPDHIEPGGRDHGTAVAARSGQGAVLAADGGAVATKRADGARFLRRPRAVGTLVFRFPSGEPHFPWPELPARTRAGRRWHVGSRLGRGRGAGLAAGSMRSTCRSQKEWWATGKRCTRQRWPRVTKASWLSTWLRLRSRHHTTLVLRLLKK
jgi:hypothetical protein